MKARIRLFQTYKKYHEVPEFDMELPPGATAGDVIRDLGIEGPDLAYLVLIIGGKRVYEDHVLQDGDELVFTAPVGGG